MKTLFAFLLVLSFGNVFAEDQVSTEGTICADRSVGKAASGVSSEESEQSSEDSSVVTN